MDSCKRQALALWSDDQLLAQGERQPNSPGELALGLKVARPTTNLAAELLAADAERPFMVPYLLADRSKPRPLVVVCPGGAYTMRADHEGEPIALWLNSLGLHAAVCHYRVKPWHFPAPLDDARRTLRLVRANAIAWGVDPARVGILGFSAGGHLAASVATFGADGTAEADDPVERHSARANLLIACYAVISNGIYGHRGSFDNLLGPAPDSELYKRLSLEKSVTQAHPPAFIWQTANDGAVLVPNALLYAGALAAAGVSFALHIYPEGRHGLGLALTEPGSVSRWSNDCAAWLKEQGWL